MFIKELKRPNTLRSQMIITMTTTMLNILLILASIGMYVLTSHKRTPAIINTSRTVNKGMMILVKRYSSKVRYRIAKMLIQFLIRVTSFTH